MLIEELLGLEEWEDSGVEDKPAKGGRERGREKGWGEMGMVKRFED